MTKAENLKKLKEAGFAVPPFTCVPERYFIGRRASRIRSFERRRAYIESRFRPRDFSRIEDGLYAVRSSSAVEDGGELSYAGLFETALNVPKGEINDRIKSCILSSTGQGPAVFAERPPEMEVIIQKMVRPEVSGVVFSANPQGILNEMVVSVSKGLGENVVADKGETTEYYLHPDENVRMVRGEDILGAELLGELAADVSRMKEIFGEFIDVEFAVERGKIWYLQVRPITTLSKPAAVLDSSNIAESFPGITLPLSASFGVRCYSLVFRSLADRVFGEAAPRFYPVADNMAACVNGRMYYRLESWYAAVGCLPFPSLMRYVWRDMLGVAPGFEGAKPPLKLKVGDAMRAFKAVMASPKLSEGLGDAFRDAKSEFERRFPEARAPEDIASLYHLLEERLLSAWDATLLNDMYTFLFTGLLKGAFGRKAADRIAGVGGLESLRPVAALAALAEDPTEEGKRHFIEEYGDRVAGELKLETPTFRTDPSLLDAALSSASAPPMPEGKEPEGPLSARAAGGIRRREESRLNRSRIFGMVRAMMLRLGEMHAEAGALESPDDIFWCEMDEAFEPPEDVMERIRGRKEDYRRFEAMPPCTRLVFDREPFNRAGFFGEAQAPQGRLSGTPSSTGTVEAPAVVVESPEEAGDVRGKIIVARSTDPGWAYLILGCAGIVAERGSLLSHTAIISRELGIPAVVGAKGAASAIKTGDIVRLDAVRGEVEVLEASHA